MKNNLIKSMVLGLLILTKSAILAQNVGYIGKKFSVELSSSVSITRATTFRNNYLLPKSTKTKFQKSYYRAPFKWNVHPKINITYTIARHVEFGFQIGYDPIKGALGLSYELDQINNFNPYSYAELYISADTSSFYNANLSTVGQGYYSKDTYFYPKELQKLGRSISMIAYFRFYPKKYIAPVGAYLQMGMGYNRISLKDNSVEGYIYYDAPDNWIEATKKRNDKPVVLGLKPYNLFMFNCEIGKKTVFSKGTYLSIALELNLIFKKKLQEYSNSSIIYTYPLIVATEIQRAQRFEFKIGVGQIF